MSNDIIISLTEAGSHLGEHLAHNLQIVHRHRPQPFSETVRAWYREGKRLIFISATGIAVRTLAPVLESKYTDPAVLVLDESGQYVIPLVSGHEGGANEWARQVADVLDAQCVITTAQHYTQPVFVAGIGCERGCPENVIAELAEATLQTQDLDLDGITLVASVDVKNDEQGLLDFARRFAQPAQFFSADHLLKYTDQLTSKSQHVFDAVGCYGVAEAAALAAAEQFSGGDAELIIPKHKNARATFALARAYLPPTE